MLGGPLRLVKKTAHQSQKRRRFFLEICDQVSDASLMLNTPAHLTSSSVHWPHHMIALFDKVVRATGLLPPPTDG